MLGLYRLEQSFVQLSTFIYDSSFINQNMDTKFWQNDPEEHDFPAALDFLELIYTPRLAKEITDRLRKSKTITKKAKDILRASRLSLLPADNLHVKANLKKVKNNQKLSPILLVRGDPLIVADGYHRISAIYYLSEDLDVPCRLVDRKARQGLT